MIQASFVRLTTTPWLRAPGDLAAVSALVRAPLRVLGGVTGPSVAPTLTSRLQTPPQLASLLGGLRGRLVVTNPCATARLPRGAGALARAALRARLAPARPPATPPTTSPWLGDARDAADARRLRALRDALPDAARDGGALAEDGAAAWVAAALYEPATLDVRFAELPSPHGQTEPAPRPMLATMRYRLALVTGQDAPPARWDAIDEAVQSAPGAAWPVGAASDAFAWFAVRLLVADAVVARQMNASTLARWAALTGRAGPASRDSYWFAESWERFREGDRRVGHVTPAEVARSRRVRSETAFSSAVALTPETERGICAPPGYGLVDCVGTLEIVAVSV